MTAPDATFREDARYRILRLLEEKPDLSQRDIARELGISLGSVNYCLQGMIAQGTVKIANFRNSRNKLAYAYLLTPRGLREKASLTDAFLQRRLAEYEALKAEIDALERELASARASVQHLTEDSDLRADVSVLGHETR